MTSPSCSLQPPRLAVWLVNLFTVPDNAEAIMGDLLEEFSQIAHQAGVVFARRWYWRQALKTIVHLIFTAYRTAPVVDLCRRGRRVLNAAAALEVGGAHHIRSSCSIPNSGTSFQPVRILRDHGDRYRICARFLVCWLYCRYRGQAKGDGGCDDAEFDFCGDDWRRSRELGRRGTLLDSVEIDMEFR